MCFTAMLEEWIKIVLTPTWGKVGDAMKKIVPLKVDNYKQTSMCKLFFSLRIAAVYHFSACVYVCVCVHACVLCTI